MIFLCGLIFLSLASISSFAADDDADQTAAQAAPSAMDAGIDDVKKRTQALFNQRQAFAPTAASPAISPALQVAPSTLARTEDDVKIKNNVFKLYTETLSGKVRAGQPVPQTVINTPGVDTLAPATPTPLVKAAEATPPPAEAPPAAPTVSSPTVISTAPPVAPPATNNLKFIGVPAPTPEAVRQSVAASTTPAPSLASATIPAPPPLPTTAPAAPIKTAALTSPLSTPQKPVATLGQLSIAPSPPPPTMSMAGSGFSDEESANFLRTVAGNDGVLLNVVDAVSPADIQAPMHLPEAVAFALKNNFEVQAAGEKTKGAYWDKMGAYSEYLPTVQVAADTGPERSQPGAINDAFGNRVLDNTHNRQDHSISISQPLIDLTIISDILSGTDKKKLADTDQRDVNEGIAFDTASIYLSLLQSRLAIRLADNYRGYLEDLSQRMQVRVTGGGAAGADLDRIRGRTANAESARIEALGEYQSNLAEFKRLTKVMPAQLVIPTVLAPAIPDTMQQAMEKALKYNPSYVSSLQKVDLAEDDRNRSFSGLLPKLSGQYTNSYSFNAGGAAEGSPVDGVYPVQKTQTVMLVAQWTLNGGTAVTGGLSGMAKEREMNLRAMDVRARIEQGIQAGYTAINAAHQRENVLMKSIAADERVVKNFEEQFKNGGRSLFDMLDAYEQLYNARLNLMRVTIAEAKAAYQVRRQMGELQQSILTAEAR